MRSWNPSAYPWNLAATQPATPSGIGWPWNLIWHRLVPTNTTVGGGDVTKFRAECTPTSHDGRFGIFQLYGRGTALGDATATALYPHVKNLRALCDAAKSVGTRRPKPLILGDTFDHLTLMLEATEQDLIFHFATAPANQWAEPPPWAPPPEREIRLLVRRTEVIEAWHAAEPAFQRILSRS
ncbi:hypothetical protein [Micromonospora sp. NPDC007220]|uniref:hypothetical protein n=1 Tax=Micromonospora sp. NPDC007220 TaxID=3154318 RepID=UPI0033F26E9F